MKAYLLFLAAIVATTMVATMATRADDKSPVQHEPSQAGRLPSKAPCLPSPARPDGSIRRR